jgi:uncharacterized damage-inducible protein DinB
MATYLQGLVDYNNWANQGLLEFLATLPPETLDATAPGVYGTVRETLGHMLTSELNYHRNFAAAPLRERTKQPEHPDVPLLQQMARDSAAFMNGALNSLPNPERMMPLSDGMRAATTIITQLVTHAAEHRAHVGTILGAHGIQLPEFDSWAYGIFAGHDAWPTDEWGSEPPDRTSARFQIR